MSEYNVNMLFGIAAFFLLLSMNSVLVHGIFSHRYRFTGTLSRFYHNLGMFFILLFAIQTIFPLYLVILNFLRISGLMMPADMDTIFFERIYLALFIVINMASFYLSSRVLESMDTLADNFSFTEGKTNVQPTSLLPFAINKETKKKLRHIYFTPRKKIRKRR